MALINLRNALMAGKRLPYDAELECLESTGTQWIDTGMPLKFPMSADMTIAMISPYGTLDALPVFGIRYGGGSADSKFAIWFSKSQLRFALNYGSYDSSWKGSSVQSGQAVHLRTDGAKLYIDGSLVADGGTVTTSDTSNTLTLFKMRDTASVADRGQCVRYYSCKIYDENNVLVRDFIPVRKGTVGYLYDRVSGKLFGNAGTGDFVLGQDVVPVEWLDNGGTAYINTEYIFKTKPRVATNCMINSSSDKDLFGTSTVDASCFIFNLALNAYTWLYYRYGSTSALTATASKPSVGQKMHIDASDKVYIDDTLILTRTGTYDFSQGSTPCRIFAARSILASRIYDLTMWDGDALVRKMLPVRVGTEGAMMDVLTRRVYRNAGTGAFGYGNDLKYPIPAA